MKKGLIVFITAGREQLDDFAEPSFAAAPSLPELQAEEIRLACSGPEIAYQWWQLLARGMRLVHCVGGTWDPARGIRLQPEIPPLRLCG
jgi:hypothetical protein